ncbi:unnamed protein product [Ectocarpus sp. 6 AP-2014]
MLVMPPGKFLCNESATTTIRYKMFSLFHIFFVALHQRSQQLGRVAQIIRGYTERKKNKLDVIMDATLLLMCIHGLHNTRKMYVCIRTLLTLPPTSTPHFRISTSNPLPLLTCPGLRRCGGLSVRSMASRLIFCSGAQQNKRFTPTPPPRA